MCNFLLLFSFSNGIQLIFWSLGFLQFQLSFLLFWLALHLSKRAENVGRYEIDCIPYTKSVDTEQV